jgi:choline dehydrogenase
MMRIAMEYDVIIIGAGASGGTIAARLSEDASRSVLLLEAGPYYPTREAMPDDLLNGNNNSYTAHDWGYRAETNSAGRAVAFPRGRVVGGSSAVNTAIALRGVPEDYDEWSKLGNDEWSWEKVLPYFRKLETDCDFDDDYHGRSGPIPVRRYREEQLAPVQAAFVKTMRALGYPETRDNNAPDSTGLGFHPMNKDADWRTRMGVGIAYLQPARHRLNLTIRGGCTTVRVLTNGQRATGVEVESGGVTQVVRGRRIVVSAGAIASPALLMRSGIGPEAHLREHGIGVVADLPGVGANLDDHPMIGITFGAREGHLSADDPLVQTTYRYTSRNGDERNDMQLMPVSQVPAGDGRLVYTIGSVIERQEARGRITLQSADPHVQPRIEQRFCESDADVQRLVDGIRFGYEVGTQPGFEHLNAGLLSPNEGILRDDEALGAWVSKLASSGFHPSCTAKMAPASDAMGVVDQRLKVHGFDNLYVADASVMPRCPRANIHLTSIMIGERFADCLKAD